METTLAHPATSGSSKTSSWAGRIISGICMLFFLFDAIAKILKAEQSVTATMALGIPENTIPAIGIILLICTIIYLIPRTAIIGAVLLTGYLGGAIAIMMRAGQPVYFALAFRILVWLGLYLRNDKVRTFFFNRFY